MLGRAVARRSHRHMPCGCTWTVVAWHREDLRWTQSLSMPVTIMDKSAGNVGRESLSFLRFIVEHYARLERDVGTGDKPTCLCFSQGSVSGAQMREADAQSVLNNAHLDPWQHISGISPKQMNLTHHLCGEVTCQRIVKGRSLNGVGETSCEGARWECFPKIMGELGLRTTANELFHTFAGGFMIVRAEAIVSVPISLYWKLLFAHLSPSLCGSAASAAQMPYVMERTWVHLWSAANNTYQALPSSAIISCKPPPSHGWKVGWQ